MLYLERSVELLIAIWGVLKAGAAYVPLATNYPKDRVAYIVKDVEAPLVITSKRLETICKGFKSLSLNTDWRRVEGYPTSRPKINTRADDLAYIIYTSGSTGPPKGVMIAHKALINYVLWARETYFEQDKLVMPLYTTPAFDLTVTSMFVPMVAGGSIVIYPEVDGGADLSLLKVIEDDLVDIIKLTPSHLTLLDNKELVTSRVKKLIVGGEKF